jgi:hypothetical protein
MIEKVFIHDPEKHMQSFSTDPRKSGTGKRGNSDQEP